MSPYPLGTLGVNIKNHEYKSYKSYNGQWGQNCLNLMQFFPQKVTMKTKDNHIILNVTYEGTYSISWPSPPKNVSTLK